MPQLNIYYGDSDRELIDHLQLIKKSNGNISSWVKEACLMRLRKETTGDPVGKKLDDILAAIQRIENGGLVVSGSDGGKPEGAADDAEVRDFFQTAMESFGE
jgi:hypothetical protein